MAGSAYRWHSRMWSLSERYTLSPREAADQFWMSQSSRGRCLMVKAVTRGGIMASSTRIPQAELSGLYGALVKRMSRRMFGRGA